MVFVERMQEKKHMNISIRFSCFACLRFLAATALERFDMRLPARDPDAPSGYDTSIYDISGNDEMEFECVGCNGHKGD